MRRQAPFTRCCFPLAASQHLHALQLALDQLGRGSDGVQQRRVAQRHCRQHLQVCGRYPATCMPEHPTEGRAWVLYPTQPAAVWLLAGCCPAVTSVPRICSWRVHVASHLGAVASAISSADASSGRCSVRKAEKSCWSPGGCSPAEVPTTGHVERCCSMRCCNHTAVFRSARTVCCVQRRHRPGRDRHACSLLQCAHRWWLLRLPPASPRPEPVLQPHPPPLHPPPRPLTRRAWAPWRGGASCWSSQHLRVTATVCLPRWPSRSTKADHSQLSLQLAVQLPSMHVGHQHAPRPHAAGCSCSTAPVSAISCSRLLTSSWSASSSSSSRPSLRRMVSQ